MIVAIITDESSGELEREIEKAVDEADGDVPEWIRGAIVIRLYMENDDEFLQRAEDERADS